MQINQNKLFDKDFRKALKENPKQIFYEFTGFKLSGQQEVIVHTSTKAKLYMVLPNHQPDLTNLAELTAAGTASSFACAGSASSISCFSGSFSSALTLSTTGSVGTVS